MADLRMIEINDKVNNNIPLSQEDAKFLIAEIKRLGEAYQQAKSEAFQAQRELWRNY
jgi:hypothetical protein